MPYSEPTYTTAPAEAGLVRRPAMLPRRPRAVERSVVIPVYDGEASIAVVVEGLLHELAERSTEIILVNDGSRDDSERRCRDLVERFPGRVTLIQLSRNFGEYPAVLAGLQHCRGAGVVIVDDDGQQPPDEARRLLEVVEQQPYDVVYGRYRVQRQAWWRRIASRAHNAAVCWFLGKPRGLYLSSFKAMNRFAVAQVCDQAGACPFFDGLILQVTDRIAQLDVKHRPRMAGRSGYTLAKLLRVWFGMCIGFSGAPFRLASAVGAVLFVGGLATLATTLAVGAATDLTVSWVILSATWLTALAGAILFFVGLAGVHLVRDAGRSQSGSPYVVRYVYEARAPHDD